MNPIHQFDITQQNTASLIKYCESGDRYDALIPIIPEGFKYPLYVRKATTDIYNFLQVFEEKEYEGLMNPPKNVVDLGSYVGYVAVYFAMKYQSELIISIEPDPENYRMLLLNTMPYKNIKCINAGIWNKNCMLSIADKIGGDWGTIVKEAKDGKILGISMNDIIKEYTLNTIDFLKIDIEGSEKVLFEKGMCEDWVGKVEVVHCETHDRFVSGCSEAYRSIFNNERYLCKVINQCERYSKNLTKTL